MGQLRILLLLCCSSGLFGSDIIRPEIDSQSSVKIAAESQHALMSQVLKDQRTFCHLHSLPQKIAHLSISPSTCCHAVFNRLRSHDHSLCDVKIPPSAAPVA
jgi:hypothetical protein